MKFYKTLFLFNNESSPPGSERHIEVLAQIEDVQGHPAHDEQHQGGQQQVGPPHIAPCTQHSSAEDMAGVITKRGSYQTRHSFKLSCLFVKYKNQKKLKFILEEQRMYQSRRYRFWTMDTILN